MRQPQTRYARKGDLSIAYQVVGSSGPWLIYVPGFVSHLDLQWTDLGFSRFLQRLASFTGADRTALLGFSEGGPTCAMFAATWPERTTALIVYGSYAIGRPTEEELQQAGVRRQRYERTIAAFDNVVAHWGEGLLGELLAPSARGEMQRRFWGIYERAGASPAMARALIEAAKQADVSQVLPAIQAPTLVIHRIGDIFPVGGGRYFANRVPGARFVELPGDDHAFWAGESEAVVDEIQAFLTGTPTATEPDRVLATLLFTDIVGSTERASELGDQRWRQLLDEHNTHVRTLLERFGGTELDTARGQLFCEFRRPRPSRGVCRRHRQLAEHARAKRPGWCPHGRM